MRLLPLSLLLPLLVLAPVAARAEATNLIATNAVRMVRNTVYKGSLTFDGATWRFDVYDMPRNAGEADERKARALRRTQTFAGQKVGDLQAVAARFLVWDQQARTNRAAAFDRVLGKLNGVDQTFFWTGTNAYWLPSELNTVEVQMLYGLLYRAPDLRWSLAEQDAGLPAAVPPPAAPPGPAAK
jgi:hypothetical protein